MRNKVYPVWERKAWRACQLCIPHSFIHYLSFGKAWRNWILTNKKVSHRVLFWSLGLHFQYTNALRHFNTTKTSSLVNFFQSLSFPKHLQKHCLEHVTPFLRYLQQPLLPTMEGRIIRWSLGFPGPLDYEACIAPRPGHMINLTLMIRLYGMLGLKIGQSRWAWPNHLSNQQSFLWLVSED